MAHLTAQSREQVFGGEAFMGIAGKAGLTAVGLVLAWPAWWRCEPPPSNPRRRSTRQRQPGRRPSAGRQQGRRHLAQAVRFQTVSHQDKADDQPAEWDKLHAWLQATYPAAHKAMTREVIAGHTLVYTWTGSNPALAPIVLMAHQDVVPVTPGSESAWTHPPFDGVVADGAVWGRGVDRRQGLAGHPVRGAGRSGGRRLQAGRAPSSSSAAMTRRCAASEPGPPRPC
jgi:hypothetical protein